METECHLLENKAKLLSANKLRLLDDYSGIYAFLYKQKLILFSARYDTLHSKNNSNLIKTEYLN